MKNFLRSSLCTLLLTFSIFSLGSCNTSNSSSSSTIETFADVINNNEELKQRLQETGKSTDTVSFILTNFLGISDIDTFYNATNKLLCLGRAIEDTYDNPDDITGYQNYAAKYNGWRYWVGNYEYYIENYTLPFLRICNETLLHYCCYADWDFVFVTNPYHYMEEHLNTQYGGVPYAKEIAIARSYDYNNFIDSNITWDTVPNPGEREEAYYAYAGYTVSR